MAFLALHLKSNHTLKPSNSLLKLTTSSHYFSSSSSSSSNNNNGDFSSLFNDVKSKLNQQQQQQQQQQSVEPYPFATSLAAIKSKLKQQQQQSTKEGVSPSIIASLGSSNPSQNDGIRSNLSGFRRPTSNSPEKTQGVNFKAVRESLRELRRTTGGNQGVNKRNSMSFNNINSNNMPNFKAQSEMAGHGGPIRVVGGGELPSRVFGKEMKEKKEGGDENGVGEEMKWMVDYNVDELGKKLRELRPEGKENGNWFSLWELNERLKKVKEIDEKEMAAMKGSGYVDMIKTIRTMNVEPKNNSKMIPIQVFDMLGPGTPNFMLSPPKEHLVEKYFHPDNMSSEEKLKLKLKKVRDEFKMHESDCGSARVQVAQLTTEILHLSSVLHKKDKHSRRGLQAKVQQRKKLLKYLRRTDWESYCFVLTKLGLRDNPDYKN